MTDVNLNAAECVQQASNFTGATYTNICTGVKTFVPYGSLDMAAMWFLLSLGVAVIVILVVFIVMMARSA